jgi:hypothetical protein
MRVALSAENGKRSALGKSDVGGVIGVAMCAC